MKEQLQEGDILVFKSGTERKYTQKDEWMIENFYDKDLNCLTNDKFTVVKVLRPHYDTVYYKPKQRIRIDNE